MQEEQDQDSVSEWIHKIGRELSLYKKMILEMSGGRLSDESIEYIQADM